MPTTAQTSHRRGLSEKAFHCRSPKRDQHARLNDRDLLLKIWQTGIHLGHCRLAIAGSAHRHVGSALKNIRDVYDIAAQAHCLDNLCEELPGFANKWLPLQILVLSRR